MIKTAICDDELHAKIKEFFLNKRIEFQITEYLSGKALAEHARDYDLIFLDVKMQD